SLPFAASKENEIEDGQAPERAVTSDFENFCKTYPEGFHGHIDLVADGKYYRLPSLSVNDNLLAYHTDPNDTQVKFFYSKEENCYYVKIENFSDSRKIKLSF